MKRVLKPLRSLLLSFLLMPMAMVYAAHSMQYHQFKTSDGVSLSYIEAGSGDQSVVFIPGWLMPAAIFKRQIETLSLRYRVLALDPRSQGRSELTALSHSPKRRIQDLHEFLQAVGGPSFVLVGWSLGVLETLDYLANYQPAGLRGLVLIDNSVGEGKPPPARASNFSQTMQNPEKRQKYLRDFSRGMFATEPPADIWQPILESVLRVPPDVALQLINQPYPRAHWSQSLAKQTVPVLYAVRPRFKDQGEALLAKRPAGLIRVEIFATAGHALFVDEAARFNRLVDEFCQFVFSTAR